MELRGKSEHNGGEVRMNTSDDETERERPMVDENATL